MNSTQIVGLVIAIAIVAAVLVFLNSRKKPKSIAAPKQAAEPIAKPAAAPQIEIPEATDQRADRLKDRLTKSQSGIGGALKNLFNSSDLSESDWTNLEDELILADVGAKASVEIVEKLRSAVKSAGSAQSANLKDVANQELTKLVDGGFDRSLKVKRKNDAPAVVLTVGVNGTGKTTTTGKLARMLSGQDLDVLLGAADTFRAAAAEQLITWGDRVGVPVVRGTEGSDPAAVAFEAVKTGIENEVDVVLIDTAGRLHTKQGLMDELGKVHRVASKSTSIDEVLLVIDATTGQNGLAQARVFAEVVPVTGVVLTKLDGTAKGGIVIAVQQELGVPVKLVGLGEGPDDLAPFDAKSFVDGLLNVN